DVSGGAVYLTLYGTGVRNRTALTSVTSTIGGVPATVLFAGSQGTFPALDQVNVQIPSSLRGRGLVAVVVTADGTATNTVNVTGHKAMADFICLDSHHIGTSAVYAHAPGSLQSDRNMSQTFRLYWLRETACDAGTLVDAAALDASVRDQILDLTKGQDGEFLV